MYLCKYDLLLPWPVNIAVKLGVALIVNFILSTHPHITKPTHTHTHTLQNLNLHTPTHYKTHTYTHPHIIHTRAATEGRVRKTLADCAKHVLPSVGRARDLYSLVTSDIIVKLYKSIVKSMSDQSPETFKSILKSKINSTEVKVGIKSLKSLRDGRVLIEVGTADETNLLSANINDKYGEALEANVPILRKPRLIILTTPEICQSRALRRLY